MLGGRIRKTHTMPDDTSNHGRLPRDGAEGNDKLLQVLGAGIEPAWGCPHRILSPARLPVPPPRPLDTALTQFRVLSCSLHREPSDLSPLRLPFRHSGARLVLRRDDSLDVSLLGEHALREVQPLLDIGEPSLHVLERVESRLHVVTAAHP